jgi:DNA-binding transcriptional LysR family regulator
MIIKKKKVFNTQEAHVVAAIYKHKNISLAAEELGVTTNYINVTLLRLELKLGCQLFLRRQKIGAVDATDYGKLIAPKLMQIAKIHLWILEKTNK